MGLFDFLRTPPASEPLGHVGSQATDNAEELSGIDPRSDIASRGIDFDVYGPVFRETAKNFGITDREAPTSQQQRTAFRSTFWRCVTMRSNVISRAIGLFEVVREVGPDEYEPVEAMHPWRRLLKRPNGEMASSDLWRWLSLSRDLSKGAFFFVGADARGMPTQMHPVFSEYGVVNAVPSNTGTVGGFVYWRADGDREPVAREDCLWFRHLSPVTAVESMSLLEAVAYHTDSDLYLNIYQRDYLKNGRMPPAYLSTDQPITDDKAIQRMQDTFVQKRLGIQRGGKPFLLTHGAEVKTLAINPKDALYADIKGLNKSDIYSITGVPEGLFDKSTTFASSKTHELVFIKHTIQPECDAIADQMSHQFRMAFGASEGLCVRCPDLTPTDPEAEARIRKMLFETAQRSVNDFLKEDGMEEVDGGDRRYISISLKPIDDEAKTPSFS